MSLDYMEYADEEEMQKAFHNEFLKYNDIVGAYFVSKNFKMEAEISTYEGLTEKINNADFDPDVTTNLRTGDNRLVVVSKKAVKLDKPPKLPSGLYTVIDDRLLGIGLKPYIPIFDEYINLNEHTGAIEKDIEVFLTSKDKYKELGLLHKRGILLYGPPGTGKTVLLEMVCSKFADRTRTFIIPPEMSVAKLSRLRGLFDDMPTIFIFEELTTAAIDRYNGTSLLSFLDGEGAWDGSLTFGTTNYPELLPGNIVDRPSRFDKIYKLGNPNAETRRIYLESKLDKSIITDSLIEETKDMSIAYLKELVVSFKIFDKSPMEIVKEFIDRKARIKKEFAEPGKKPGF